MSRRRWYVVSNYNLKYWLDQCAGYRLIIIDNRELRKVRSIIVGTCSVPYLSRMLIVFV